MLLFGLMIKREMMMTKQPPKLLDQVRHTLRVKHYSIRTEDVYVNWIKRFILFHNKQHPRKSGVTGVGRVMRVKASIVWTQETIYRARKLSYND